MLSAHKACSNLLLMFSNIFSILDCFCFKTYIEKSKTSHLLAGFTITAINCNCCVKWLYKQYDSDNRADLMVWIL